MSAGYRVTEAVDGQHAIRIAEWGDFDLVLVLARGAELDGSALTVCRYIKECADEPRPFVVLTDAPESTDVRLADLFLRNRGDATELVIALDAAMANGAW